MGAGVEEVIIAGIYVIPVNWREVFVKDECNATFWINPNVDLDYTLLESGLVAEKEKSRSDRGGKGKGKEIEKGQEDVPAFNLKAIIDCAPRFEMVGDSGGLVNPHCKPHRMIKLIIENFSLSGDTVLDFFLGGQVLKTSLMRKRECFVYANTEKELNFIEAYAIPCPPSRLILIHYKIGRKEIQHLFSILKAVDLSFVTTMALTIFLKKNTSLATYIDELPSWGTFLGMMMRGRAPFRVHLPDLIPLTILYSLDLRRVFYR